VPAKIGSAPPPILTDRRRGGGGSGWVELVRAHDDIDAHLLSGRLNEAGIDTRAVTDRFAPGAWLYGGSNPWAPVTILVRRIQLEDARVVLAEIAFHGPDAPPPQHASGQQGWQAPTLWWITAVVLGALLTAVSVLEAAGASPACDPGRVCERSVHGGRPRP
jgi:hypothetical protein